VLDAKLRPLIDPPLTAAARRLVARGITADQITIAGFAAGLAAAVAIACGNFTFGLFLIAANRLADGLDGAVARLIGPTDRGGFLDIALDFVFYASVPLAFAWADPAHNALPAAFLIASFLANGAAFLAFAIIAAKRNLTTDTQGAKSIFYLAGLAEGAETIAVFVAFCLWPTAFPWLAAIFAALCALSAAARVIAGYRTLN
jgi:phosphatidylglycerophosphate synthase